MNSGVPWFGALKFASRVVDPNLYIDSLFILDVWKE